MDALPLELWLKLAEACDFATVCALSKLNKRFHALVWSNPKSFERHSHEKLHFKQISLKTNWESKVLNDEMKLKCSFGTKGGFEKVMNAKILKGSANMPASDFLANGWKCKLSKKRTKIRTTDADKFLRELFSPILGKATIHTLTLVCLNSSTLRTIGDLLERWRPAIYELDLCFGTRDRNVFDEAVRIVELASPRHLILSFGDNTSEEICEKVMAKIANKTVTKVSISALNLENMDIRREASTVTATMRFPKCPLLGWVQSYMCLVVNLSVTSIVDVIEEWCNNTREIVHYKFCFFETSLLNKFKEELRARDLPIQIHDEAMYRIEKLEKRGDDQDELSITFPRVSYYPRENCSVEINSRLGEAAKVDGKVEIENFEKCRYC